MNNFPNKKYKIILADPPWEYDDKALAGNRGAGCKYDVMSDEDLKKLPVQNIADDDCILFMWATFPKIQEALDLIKAWGFVYKTVAFVWYKKSGTGSQFIGLGGWTRSNVEIVFLATKGNPKRINAGIRQVVESTPKEHSVKPNEVRSRILKLCGDLSRIELFSRTKVHGWDVFGNDEKLQDNTLEEYY